MLKIPTLFDVKNNKKRIQKWVVETPVWECQSAAINSFLSTDSAAKIYLKLELFQQTGSFKARGAITTLLHQKKSALKKGIVAASAGNHAVAVSYAAKVFNTKATVIMPKTASVIKMQRCKDYGADVILVNDMNVALKRMTQIAEQEKSLAIHPFEGPLIALGTGTIGLELLQQIKNFDAVIVPVGGGGLCAGIAAVIKQKNPKCLIYGVEPTGANVVQQSLIAGKPITLEKVNTIAESLATPCATPYTFELFRKFVDEIVCVEDAMLIKAMQILFYEMKLAVEPAAAAALAAIMFPLQKQLQNKCVVLIISGTNIDLDRYCQLSCQSGIS